MLKFEDFGYKLARKRFDGEIEPFLDQTEYKDEYSLIGFIDLLDKHETISFIYDLDRCLEIQDNIEEGFFSDSVEHMEILYQYPNVNVNDDLIISMENMKVLLNEWLNFAFK